MNFNSFNTALNASIKFGSMSYPSRCIAFQKQYIYGIVPVHQITSGHILIIPKRQVLNFKDLEPTELFDIALALRFLPKPLEATYGGTSITIYVQNYSKEDEVKGEKINHMFIHVIVRKRGDYKANDDIYPILQDYDRDFRLEYSKKIASQNVTSQKTIDSLAAEAQTLRDKLNKAKVELQ